MASNLDTLQSLLQGMQERFLDELPERCDSLDNLLLGLEKSADQESFNELYRKVHSLKGSGGTHGLPIITTVCHHLENLLTEAAANNQYGSEFTSQALGYVDLIRQVEQCGRDANPDYNTIENRLKQLRQSDLHSRKSGLIAEPSILMSRLYQQALVDLPVQLYVVSSGLAALERLVHERYDFVVVGRELKDLNGVALMAAVRASQGINRDIPAILVSSSSEGIPSQLHFSAVMHKDKTVADNLEKAVRSLLN